MSLSDRFAEGVEKGRVSRPAGGYIGQNSYVKLSTDIKIEQSMKNKETDFQKKKKKKMMRQWECTSKTSQKRNKMK